MKRYAWVVAALLVTAAAGHTIAVAGTFPGTNGRIAFSSEGEIRTMLSDGTGRRALTDTPVGGESEPAWNAAGTRLVFGDSEHSFATARADGTGRTSLVSMDTFAGNATWSADGSVIAFDHLIGSMEGHRIYVVPAAGGTATELSGLDARDPTYSPDGSRIAFEAQPDGSGIGVMNADGSNVSSITTGAGGNAGDHDPSWSPDGSKIAFRRDFQIWTVNADGSGATPLTTVTEEASYPTWSPDGTQIAFQSDNDIWVMNSDGSELANITNTADEEEREPDWGTGAPAPSGDGVQFSTDAFSANESDTAAEITVVRTGDATGTAIVGFVTADGTAKLSSTRRCLRCQVGPPDYSLASGTLVFGPGETEQTFQVPIVDDSAIEDDETVRLTLRKARARGTTSAPLGPRSTATLTIVDNDPNVSFARSSSVGSEEDGAFVGVVVSTSSATGVTVNYAVTGGTATEGQDYTLGSGTLTVRPGRASRIPLTVIDDELKEPNETVRIELSSPTNAELGRITTHTLTIRDNDPFGDVAGDTPASALVVDLARQPRQVIRERLIARAGDAADVYRVHLEAGDDLAIDVDPVGALLPLRSSTLTIYGDDGTTQLALVGGSDEPDGSGATQHPAHLFHADAEGDYYLSLSPEGSSFGDYRIGLHRLAIAEGAQDPAVLDAEGPMFAWLRGDTLGITGPTGHGFTLQGDWTQTSTNPRRGGPSSTYTLAPGSEVDLLTALGELRIEAVGGMTVTTSPNLWGDTFGVVPDPIPFRAGIPMDALIGELRDEYGLEMTVSALENWTIMMGSRIAAGEGVVPSGVQHVAPGVPYLFFDDEPAIAASLGPVRIEQNALDEKILIVLDPIDPFLYIRAEEIRGVKKPTLAFSRRGYIPFHPQLEPTLEVPVGLTTFYSHVFASGAAPPNPALAKYFTISADGSIDLDADDDGTWLAGEGNAHQLFMGDLSALENVLRDINLGANGRVTFHYNSKQFDFVTPLGRATAVYNGQEEALWFRGRKHPEENPLAGTPFSFLGMTPEDFIEGIIHSDGRFAVTGGTRLNLPGDGLLEIKLDLTDEAVTADVTGTVEMTGSVRISGVEAKCTAKGGARGVFSFSYASGLHMSGSLGVDGRVRCYAGGQKVASASFDLSGRIDDGRLIFRLPILGEEAIRIF
ncbi:MAG: Calx-beta domain-containing protein [Actinomycetota bacterium]